MSTFSVAHGKRCTYLFYASNGHFVIHVLSLAVLDQVVVDFARAEEELLDLGCVLCWNALFWDETAERRALGEVGQGRLGLRVTQ